MRDLIKPEWIRVKYRHDATIEAIKKDTKEKVLVTVCQEALCPNIWECWSSGTATFMLMGDTCTRGCAFCHVKTARVPGKLDPLEHEKLLESIRRMKLTYVVLTSVDRDDLPDQGAEHLAHCIAHLKKNLPELRIENLIPDFRGDLSLVKKIVDAGPDVLAHNIETIERLTPKVRDRRAGYRQSLAVLKGIKEMAPAIHTKSGIMAGFGEKKEEVEKAMDDLRAAGVSFLTVGQYLRPSKDQLAVREYVDPELFRHYERAGLLKGFHYVASGPFVRSSYKAGELFIEALLKREEQAKRLKNPSPFAEAVNA